MPPSLYRSIDGFLFHLSVETCLACEGASHKSEGNWDWKLTRGNRHAVISMTMQEDKIGTEVSCWENGVWNKSATTWFLCTVPTSEIQTYLEGWLMGATVSSPTLCGTRAASSRGGSTSPVSRSGSGGLSCSRTSPTFRRTRRSGSDTGWARLGEEAHQDEEGRDGLFGFFTTVGGFSGAHETD